MKTVLVCVLLLFLPGGCLTPPNPWEPPDGWPEEADVDVANDGADVSADENADSPTDIGVDEKTDLADESKDADEIDEACATDEVDADIASDQDSFGEVELKPEVAAEIDAADELDAPESEMFDEVENIDAEVDLDVPDEESPADISCPPGYSWDAEKGKCVSFCPADQYFEAKLMKCVYYPCCDLTAAWKVSVLDSELMIFTIYDLQMDQTISYLQAVLMLDSPPEVAECTGSLEKKEMLLICLSETYSLQFSSTTVDGTGKFSGFYSYSYKKGGVKAGPVNFEKK